MWCGQPQFVNLDFIKKSYLFKKWNHPRGPKSQCDSIFISNSTGPPKAYDELSEEALAAMPKGKSKQVQSRDSVVVFRAGRGARYGLDVCRMPWSRFYLFGC